MKVYCKVTALVEMEVPDNEVVKALVHDDDGAIEWMMDELYVTAMDKRAGSVSIEHVGRTWAYNEFNEEMVSDLDYDF